MGAQISRRTAVLGIGGVLGAAATAQVAQSSGAFAAPSATGSYRPMQYGSTGSDVRAVQTSLAAAGFWCGSADGSYGALTQQAVMALQKAYGARRTGRVDYWTWTKVHLRRRTYSRYRYDGIEIDKTRQLLLVVRGAAVHSVFNTSTGNGEWFSYQGRWVRATTPSGTFSIFRGGSNGWDYGALGGLYRPRYFNGGIAIHGSPSIPGYAASHGCCRLTTRAQDHLLATGRLAIGTKVRVY